MQTRCAVVTDVESVSALLTANTVPNGGELLGDWSIETVRERIASGLVLVTTDGETLSGTLLTEERERASVPLVVATLEVWPGRPDAYVYGPVCVCEKARGRGVLEALYGELLERRPDREAVLFVRADNVRSQRAHVRLGMRKVTSFTLDDEAFDVFSNAPPPGLR